MRFLSNDKSNSLETTSAWSPHHLSTTSTWDTNSMCMRLSAVLLSVVPQDLFVVERGPRVWAGSWPCPWYPHSSCRFIRVKSGKFLWLSSVCEIKNCFNKAGIRTGQMALLWFINFPCFAYNPFTCINFNTICTLSKWPQCKLDFCSDRIALVSGRKSISRLL